MEREEVYKIIDGERDYQDERWCEHTTASGGKHKPGEWLSYIYEYWFRANRVNSTVSEPDASNEVMDNIRKIAAMCVAAAEQNGCPPRE